MRASILLGLFLLGPCDKEASTGDPAAASANAAASAAGTAAAPGTGAAAAGTGAAAAGGNPAGGGPGAAATVGTDKKGVMVNPDSGIKIVNDDKKLGIDGGKLDLQNGTNKGSVAVTDAGTVLKGADGKTLTIPPVPGLK